MKRLQCCASRCHSMYSPTDAQVRVLHDVDDDLGQRFALLIAARSYAAQIGQCHCAYDALNVTHQKR